MQDVSAEGETVCEVRRVLEGLRSNAEKLNAIAQTMDEFALVDARHRDGVAALGAKVGPLHGLPFVVKDIIDVAGVPTRSGSLTRKDNPPCESDAPVVHALRAAGAIPVAKSNTVEFAIGGWGTNVSVGTPRNPWDMTTPRNSGGSSNGTGVLVGSGLVPAGLGTDTGGSVRIPSAFCGCVGLKTSVGLVSRSGVTPLSETFDTVGPMTSSVKLAAEMLAVMQGPDPKDASTLGPLGKDPLRGLERGVSGMRLGRITNDAMRYMSADVAQAFDAALDLLREAGATITDVHLPMELDTYQRVCGVISTTESYSTYKALADDESSLLGWPNRRRFLLAQGMTAVDRVQAWRDRAQAIDDFEAVIDTLDAIVLPTTPFTAIPLSEVDESNATYGNHTRFVNYLELAGLAVPMSLTDAGLPTSLQIVVRRFDDPLALRIGHAFEQARGEFPKPTLV